MPHDSDKEPTVAELMKIILAQQASAAEAQERAAVVQERLIGILDKTTENANQPTTTSTNYK